MREAEGKRASRREEESAWQSGRGEHEINTGKRSRPESLNQIKTHQSNTQKHEQLLPAVALGTDRGARRTDGLRLQVGESRGVVVGQRLRFAVGPGIYFLAGEAANGATPDAIGVGIAYVLSSASRL